MKALNDAKQKSKINNENNQTSKTEIHKSRSVNESKNEIKKSHKHHQNNYPIPPQHYKSIEIKETYYDYDDTSKNKNNVKTLNENFSKTHNDLKNDGK